MRGSRKPITAEQALIRLENLCSRSEQSEYEVSEKLRRWGISPGDAGKIIESLQRGRFIDERRYVSSFVNDKVRFARWGRRKIIQALMLKRVDRELIREAIAAIDEDMYLDNLRHVARRKIGSMPEMLDSYEGRTKIYRHLLSAGYESNLASAVLREIIAEKE